MKNIKELLEEEIKRVESLHGGSSPFGNINYIDWYYCGYIQGLQNIIVKLQTKRKKA